MIAALLKGPLSLKGDVAEQGLKVIGDLADEVENCRLLESAGACEGEFTVFIFVHCHSIG